MANNLSKILVIKSDTSELNKLELFVNELFGECNISSKYFNMVYLCISEAVINSVQHGNKEDKNKSVSIVAEYGNKQLGIKVIDEGEGFNIDLIDNPTTLEKIKKESGRGIFIGLRSRMNFYEVKRKALFLDSINII